MMHKIFTIMGAIFTFIGAVMCGIMYFVVEIAGHELLGDTYVNGVLVAENEPISVIPFYGIGAVFALIGIIFLSIGVRKLIQNKKTEDLGVETFGVVIDIHSSNVFVNGREELAADIIYVDQNGTLMQGSDAIGFNWNICMVGDYVRIKEHNGDVNFIGRATAKAIPYDLKDRLDSESYIVRQNCGWRPDERDI